MAQVWPFWYRDVLAGLNAPDTAKNELFLNVWQTYEQSGAQNNPLDTTEPGFGGTDFNSAHVKSYPTTTDGADATVATLENGRYPDIVAALRSGDPFAYSNVQGVADQVTTWGTPNFGAWYLTQGRTATTGPLSSGTGPASSTHQVDTAWAHLMRTLAITVPRHIDRVAAARARIRNAVR